MFLKSHFPIIIAALLIVSTFIFKFHTLITNQVEIHYTGDENARILDSANLAWHQDHFSKMGTAEFWLDIHPMGDILLRSYWLDLVTKIKGNTFDPVIPSQILALIVSSIFLVTMTFLLKRVISQQVALIFILFTLSSQTFIHVSIRALGENSILLPFSLWLSCLFFAFFHEKKNNYFLIISGLSFLFMTFFRTEIVLYLPVLCLILWREFGFKKACLYGGVASSFTLGKIVYTKFFDSKHIQYIDAYKHWNYKTFGLKDFVQTSFFKSFFLNDIHWVILIIFAIALLYKKIRPIEWNSVLEKRIFTLSGTLSLSYLLFVFILAMFGFIPTQQRSYIYFVIPFYIAFSLLISLVLSHFWRNKSGSIKWQGSILIVISVLAIIVNTKTVISSLQKQVSQDMIKMQDYILGILKPSDSLYIDYLYYWEWNLRAHISHIKSPKDTCSSRRCEGTIHEEEKKQRIFRLKQEGLKFLGKFQENDYANFLQGLIDRRDVLYVTIEPSLAKKRVPWNTVSFLNVFPYQLDQDRKTTTWEIPPISKKITMYKIIQFGPYTLYRLLNVTNL